MENVRHEVGIDVRNALASVGLDRANAGPGPRGNSLNDPKNNEVDSLTDDISKAKFVLWRDNLDLHLEDFSNFGVGIDGVLRRTRLHQALIKSEDICPSK